MYKSLNEADIYFSRKRNYIRTYIMYCKYTIQVKNVQKYSSVFYEIKTYNVLK